MEQEQFLQVFDLGEIIVTGLVAAQRTDPKSGGGDSGRRSTVGHAGVHMVEVTWKTEDTGGGGGGDALAVAVELLELLTARTGAASAGVAAIGTAPDVAHHRSRGIVVAAGVRDRRCHHSRGGRRGG